MFLFDDKRPTYINNYETHTFPITNRFLVLWRKIYQVSNLYLSFYTQTTKQKKNGPINILPQIYEFNNCI